MNPRSPVPAPTVAIADNCRATEVVECKYVGLLRPISKLVINLCTVSRACQA